MSEDVLSEDRHAAKMAKKKAARDKLMAGKTVERGLLVVHTGPGKGKTTAALGMALRCVGHGFKVAIIANRPSTDGDGLRKEWRRLTPKTLFCFAGDRGDPRLFLEKGNYVLFFGDSDSGIVEARKAGVYPIRVKRSRKSFRKEEDYRPGTFGELVLPWSQY